MSPCSRARASSTPPTPTPSPSGLAQVKGEIEAGTFTFSRALEDIHMNVESRLADIVGPAAGRLHTARSRNDQVALDFRLWVRDTIDALILEIAGASAGAGQARARLRRHGHAGLHPSAVGAARHLRPSSARLCRDAGARRGALRGRAQAPQRMPARRGGAGRHLLSDRPRDDGEGARLRPADRQFARQRRRPRLRARGARAAAIAATHLSRFAEEIVLWTTPQFGFVRLTDAFSTGSSIMPQKRNPDAAELVRGKTGRVVGALVGLLMVMKGLPLAYSKDMQEDKEGLFDALETLSLCARRDDRHGRGPDARSEADEGGGGRGLRHRDRPRRLARAHAQSRRSARLIT